MKDKFTAVDTGTIRGIDYLKGTLTLDLGEHMVSFYRVPTAVANEFLESDEQIKFMLTILVKAYQFGVL